MLPIIFLLFSINISSACKTDIQKCILSAIDRIQSSEKYDLIPGVYFLKSNNSSDDIPQNGSIVSRAERVFKTHDLHWNALPGIDFKVRNGEKGFSLKVESQQDQNSDSSRTFFLRRRLKMMMLPIMFKLGVITTLLALLTVFSLKGLSIGVFLLALALGSLFSKLKLSHHGHGGWDHGGWEPHKEVHLHVHPFMSGHGHASWQRGDQPYVDPYYAQAPNYRTSRESKLFSQ